MRIEVFFKVFEDGNKLLLLLPDPNSKTEEAAKVRELLSAVPTVTLPGGHTVVTCKLELFCDTLHENYPE